MFTSVNQPRTSGFVQFGNSGRIFVSMELFSEEWEYIYGSKENETVTFTYYNVRTCKESERHFTYSKALELALARARDGRYKNFEFVITK